MAEQRRTACNRDCPDSCSVLVTVERGRAIALRGDKAHPVTRGALCYRTAGYLAAQYAPDRILTPLVRTSRGFRALSWDQALALLADRLTSVLRESGPASILHYRSGGSLGLLKRV